MEDRLLVLKCRSGSAEALSRIYARYKRDLLVLAVALLNDKTSAEDVLHDVFLSFVRNISNFRLTGSLKAYLATCVANRVRNVNRAKGAHTLSLDEAQTLSSDTLDPGRTIMWNEQLQRLSDALCELPYEQREVIMLHSRGSMRFSKIADLQGVSTNTVKSRYRYGLSKLRSILNSETKK